MGIRFGLEVGSSLELFMFFCSISQTQIGGRKCMRASMSIDRVRLTCRPSALDLILLLLVRGRV